VRRKNQLIRLDRHCTSCVADMFQAALP
jgi:hypothetical protein